MKRLLADLATQPGRVLGTWTQFTDPAVIDLLGSAGYTFTIIDGEHGAIGVETAAALVRACEAAGVVPLVRVPRGDTVWIGKLLDAGAAGIVAPGVESADEAAALVAATRFAPAGSRGACPIVRAAEHSLAPWSQVVERQRAAGVIALVETAAGVAQCEAIAHTPGLMGLMVGPFDLSVALGLAGQIDHADVQAGARRVVAAARTAGIDAWVPVFDADPARLGAQVAGWAAQGVRHFVIGADKIIVAGALASYRALAVQ